MKILLGSHCFYPSTGGIETVTDLLAREFHDRGNEVRVVTQTEGKGSFPYQVVRRPRASEVSKLVKWCDVFLQNNISLRTIWPTLAIKRPLFITHQTWLRPPGQRFSIAESSKRLALRRATNISISNAIAENLGVPSTVIGNPFDDRVFRDFGGQRDNDLVFVGRLVSDKGCDILLDALQQLQHAGKRYRLTIVGEGPERERLVRFIEDHGLSDQVKLVGTRRGPDLAALLNIHKVLVVPSRWPEPFGIVAVEGIAGGCVVIGSSDGGLPEAIGPGGVTFSNGDPAGLAQRIDELLSAPEARRPYLESAARHLAKFRRAAVADRYLQIMGVTAA